MNSTQFFLELEEHYTDTHGYTEINFAAFAMLGKRFCPRIRKISKQRIYRIDTDRDYGVKKYRPFLLWEHPQQDEKDGILQQK